MAPGERARATFSQTSRQPARLASPSAAVRERQIPVLLAHGDGKDTTAASNLDGGEWRTASAGGTEAARAARKSLGQGDRRGGNDQGASPIY